MWNDMPTDIKVCKSMFTFLKMYKALLLQPYQFWSCFYFILFFISV